MEYRDGINELKKRYHNNEVSVLVGAGFSKNVYEHFPSWDELLYDMVKYLYEAEIENEFQYKLQYFHHTKIDYQIYSDKKIKELINRKGYLNIVSDFLEKKGIREAIETYIEKRIPHIDIKNSTLSFYNSDKKIYLEDSDFDAHIKLLEGAWDNIYTTNYDKLLEFTSKRFGKNWNLIREAQELSFSKQAKAIIKLHGDLCNPTDFTELQNHVFEFDGNCHYRYIISKEDYENYPIKHEAFTQLMRISLLQGTFCLLGFSGNDPNFLSWIRWVRDILVMQRKKESDKTSETSQLKIFLLDITADQPSPEKDLFYKNHNIFHIPLLKDEVRNIIGASEIAEPKALIIAFLSYIYDHPQYSLLWKKVYSCKYTVDITHSQKDVSINNNILEFIQKLSISNRIIKNIHYQSQFLSDIYTQKEWKEQEIQLLLLALRDTYYLPEYYPGLIKKLENSSLSPEQTNMLDYLKERSITLYKPFSIIESKDDCFIYEKVLRYAFSLDFTNLKETLFMWIPQGVYSLKKAVFLSLFDREKAKAILLEFIDRELEIKERYYATQLLNLIGNYLPARYPTAKYENQNIDGLHELKKTFINKVIQRKEKLKPYGYRGKTYHFGNKNTAYETSLRVLQFLIEFPTLLNFQYFSVIDDNEWYKIFRNIFIYFPYPTLFYSIQCHSSDILKRIGQEYAYSDDLYKSQLPDMLKRLLDALINKDTPKEFLLNIQGISKEFFVTVKPALWEDKFMTIWRNTILPNYNNINGGEEIFKFICEALSYISSKECITEIIIDCLKREKGNIDNTIQFFYHLRISKKNILSNRDLQEAVVKFIANINIDKEFAIAGNIYPILSSQDIENVSIKIENIIKGKKVSEVAFMAISYFAKRSKKNESIVKDTLINNVKLWHNGIQATCVTPANFIQLSKFKANIKWTKNEIYQIYDKLKESFNQLTSSYRYNNPNKGFPFITYDSLLEEMFHFIVEYQKELSSLTDYQEIQQKLSSELEKQRGFVDINEALISDDDTQIIKGLNQLYTNIKLTDIKDYEIPINLLIDRILFKRKEGLQSCFNHLSHYLTKYYRKDNLSPTMIDKLLLITKTYSKETFQKLDMEIPTIIKSLILIASSLKKMGYESPSINQWICLKKSRRFNRL